MKRLITLALVMVVAISMLSAAGAPEATAAKGEQITLNVWHIGVDVSRRATMEKAIARYQAANPNVKVVEQAIENDPYKTKLKTAMGGGNPPDLFITWGG
ncbi:MAG: extracellular solute-binding protein, partial [Spirochaetales bacterium]|nr:extracellular solute-binding protein [Spirochaetales bacterium]